MIFDIGFYYVDDTQSGAIGQWWKIGERILAWDWSFVNPTVWQSGNYLAEGAWGLFSPVIWLVGVGSHVLPNMLVYVVLVKFACFAVASFGVWLLARTFGADPRWAAVIATASTLTAFTLYMDAASWVNGFMAWSLWPIAWALIRRAVRSNRSPLLAVVASCLVVGIGYVHATLALAFTLLATIIEVMIARDRAGILRAWGIAIAAGCFAIIVHIPGLLTAPVSGRSLGMGNTGLLTVDLSDLATSPIALGDPQFMLFSQSYPNEPLFYISWLLPLFALIDWKRFATLLSQRTSLLIVGGIALAAVLLPSDFGPLRFPIRVLPYVAVSSLVILGLGLSLARARISRPRWVVTFSVLGASAFIAAAAQPTAVLGIAVTALVAAGGLFAVLFVLSKHDRETAERSPSTVSAAAGRDGGRRRMPVVVATAMAVTFALLGVQHSVASSPALRDYQIPTWVDALRSPLSETVGDTIVVGVVPTEDGIQEEYWADTLVGNLFYMTDASVQNAYTSVYYPEYQNRVCMMYNGYTCPELYGALFTEQAQTGEELATLMGVSTIQVLKSALPAGEWRDVPSGWHVIEDTRLTRSIARDEPIPGAGGVVWSSDGVRVTELSRDAGGVRMRVESVPADGGTVALSRIAWPGYSVSGPAAITDPTDGFLMSLELEPGAQGQEITVSFAAPGWPLQVLAAIILVGLVVALEIRRRRSRPDASSEASQIAHKHTD